MQLPINNDRDISTGFQELHDLLSLARAIATHGDLVSGFCSNPRRFIPSNRKSTCFKPGRGALYCVTLPFNFDRFHVLDQALIPDFDKSPQGNSLESALACRLRVLHRRRVAFSETRRPHRSKLWPPVAPPGATMSIGFNQGFDIRSLQKRLREMSDLRLLQFGRDLSFGTLVILALGPDQYETRRGKNHCRQNYSQRQGAPYVQAAFGVQQSRHPHG
jgi:hypothetical protein